LTLFPGFIKTESREIGMFALRRSMTALSLAVALFTVHFTLAPSTVWAQSSPEAIRNYNQGIEAYQQGHAADALKKFQRATQLDPNYSDAYYNIGSLYYQMKQYEQARDMFQKSVNLNPVDGQAKYNLALSLEKLSRNEEAINVLSQIPPNDPKFAQAKAKLDELKPSLKPQVASSPNKPTVQQPTTQTPAKPTTNTNTTAATTPVITKPTFQLFSKGYDGPTGITIGPGGFMYVANYTKNQIYRVGANGDKSVFIQGDLIKGPIGLVYNPKGNELYVANYLLNNIVRVNAAGKASLLTGGLGKPYNLYLDSVNNILYVSEQEGNIISRVLLPK
jgi:tetratricopeptide (TPR) repeat protein